MTGVGAGLAEYGARLLVGTGLSVAEAVAVAAGERPASGAAGEALRDGWTAAERLGGAR